MPDRKTYFGQFDPMTADGPPCSACGAEMFKQEVNKRMAWVCHLETSHPKMSIVQGNDVLANLREQRKLAQTRADNEMVNKMDREDDLGVLGELLLELDR